MQDMLYVKDAYRKLNILCICQTDIVSILVPNVQGFTYTVLGEALCFFNLSKKVREREKGGRREKGGGRREKRGGRREKRGGSREKVAPLSSPPEVCQCK